jgi:hypothetical protein
MNRWAILNHPLRDESATVFAADESRTISLTALDEFGTTIAPSPYVIRL